MNENFLVYNYYTMKNVQIITNDFNANLKESQVYETYFDKEIYTDKFFDGYKIERITNLKEQKDGIDVKATKNGQTLFIDEKAILGYKDRDVENITLELGFVKGNYNIQGWILSKDKKTTHYFFSYPKSNKRVLETKDDIVASVSYLVAKADILNLFNQKILDEYKGEYTPFIDMLYRYVNGVYLKYGHTSKLRTMHYTLVHENKPYELILYHSHHLKERPLNLLVPKKLMEKTALKKFVRNKEISLSR